MAKSKKKRIDVVYSTNPDFEYDYEEENIQETLPPSQQNLRVMIDKKQRKGKVVTLISGFIGDVDDLKELGKKLKSKCGTGGSVKDGEVVIQGDFKVKVIEELKNMGYKVKPVG